MTDEFGDCAGMPDTYRGWKVGYDGQNLRQGGRCWLATSPDYGPLWEDNEKRWASTGEALEAATREELIAAIDAWILKNGQ